MPPTDAGVTKAHVLVLEDDRLLREALGAVLRLYGYVVREEDDPSRVASILDRMPTDVILTELSPAELRSAIPTELKERFPVICLTPDRDPGRRHALLEQGAAAVFVKPVSGADLHLAIERSLRGKHAIYPPP